MNELLVYTLRPDNTALWLPESLANAIHAHRGDRLTEDQFQNPQVQELIALRARKTK